MQLQEFKVIHEFPTGEQVVAMTQWRDMIVIATTAGIYTWRGACVEPVLFSSTADEAMTETKP